MLRRNAGCSISLLRDMAVAGALLLKSEAADLEELEETEDAIAPLDMTKSHYISFPAGVT